MYGVSAPLRTCAAWISKANVTAPAKRDQFFVMLSLWSMIFMSPFCVLLLFAFKFLLESGVMESSIEDYRPLLRGPTRRTFTQLLNP